MTSRPKGLWDTTPLLSACDETKKNGRAPTEWCLSIFEKVISMIPSVALFPVSNKSSEDPKVFTQQRAFTSSHACSTLMLYALKTEIRCCLVSKTYWLKIFASQNVLTKHLNEITSPLKRAHGFGATTESIENQYWNYKGNLRAEVALPNFLNV